MEAGGRTPVDRRRHHRTTERSSMASLLPRRGAALLVLGLALKAYQGNVHGPRQCRFHCRRAEQAEAGDEGKSRAECAHARLSTRSVSQAPRQDGAQQRRRQHHVAAALRASQAQRRQAQALLVSRRQALHQLPGLGI